jgi:glycerol-3-phosphate acyltransferase PlsY
MNAQVALAWFVAIAISYLIGSVPFAYLLVKWRAGIDVRTIGSKNVGATNAGRALGLWAFWVVFLLDVGKGFAATWFLPRLVEQWVGPPSSSGAPAVAVAAILGHNFPAFLGFRGGKGVATSLGAFLALDPFAGVAAMVTFLAVFLVTRYVSVASVGGGLGFAAAHFSRVDQPWASDQGLMTVVTVLMLGLLIARHRKNFQRLAAGTEPRVPIGGRNRAKARSQQPPNEGN